MEIPVLSHDVVLSAVGVAAAVERTREAFVRYARGEWEMPPKIYLSSPPFGDFRAMPVRGDDLALLKWVTSFPGNRSSGLPVVTGIVCLSDARTGLPLMLLDARAVTALRTGASAAVATMALAVPGTRTAGVIGCGVHGTWAALCLAEAGYGPGVCSDPDGDAAARLAGRLGWMAGSVAEALRCDVVCCVTPGAVPVVDAADLRPGMHLNMLGADGPGKAEATVEAVRSCDLFCDEWAQASHGGEFTAAAEAGVIGPDDVTELGAVLCGSAPGRASAQSVTMFDSTGLAIQDLAVAQAAWQRYESGDLAGVQTITL